MSQESLPIGSQEHRAITCICVLAAFADGSQDEGERARIQQVVNGFSDERLDLASAYQDVLDGKISMAAASNDLQSAEGRALAYEMAVCVCNADRVLNDAENKFLAELRQALHLDRSSIATHQETAQAIAAQPIDTHLPPVVDTSQEAELDKLILNAAILNGALEIMPHTLATMAIIPLQMRMVYRIGNHYGFELDRGHIKDFLATVSVGQPRAQHSPLPRRTLWARWRKDTTPVDGALTPRN